MIAKLSKGGSFSGAVQYIFGPGKGADCLAGMGVLFKDTPSIIRGFERQAAQNPRVSKPVGHVVLSFSPRDAARLDNRLLLSIAVEYLDRMGIKDTQLIIVRHRDREHPHLHILFNRVGNDGRTISDRNDRYRSERLCKQLTARYGLYFASGKEQVKEYRLREPDKTKYEIYHALCDAVPRCRNWEELMAALRREGIATEFRMRGGTSDVQGVVFAKNGYPFNGSKIDRQFCYSKIDTALERNSRPRSATCWTICCVRGLIPTRRNKPSRNNSADVAGNGAEQTSICLKKTLGFLRFKTRIITNDLLTKIPRIIFVTK